MKYILATGFSLWMGSFCTSSLNAQVDSSFTTTVDEVVVETLRMKLVSFLDTTGNLHTIGYQSLADQVTELVPAYMKTNSQGMSSTISLRGGGAERTPVFWKGFNIQSAMLGQMDYSLIPAFGFNSVSVISGNMSARLGSGALTGAVQLENQQMSAGNWNISAGQEIGMYGTYTTRASMSAGFKPTSVQVSYQRISSDNDFRYTDYSTIGFPKKRAVNGQYVSHALIYDQVVRLKENHSLNIAGWWQENSRRIPPALGAANVNARQYDRNIRAMLGYTGRWKKWTLEYKAAYFHDDLNYYDNNLADETFVHTAQQMLTTDIRLLRKFSVSAGADYQVYFPTSKFYPSIPVEHRGSVFVVLKSNLISRLFMELDVRQQWLSTGVPAPVFTLRTFSGFGPVNRCRIYLRAEGGNGYRVPTLNDRYWTPGGNPNLEAEQSWNASVSAELKGKRKYLQWNTKAEGYFHHIDNWIQWIPLDQGYWGPVNFRKVITAGIEISARLDWTFSRFSLHTSGFYAWFYSYNMEPGDAYGKQIVYQPDHQAYLEQGLKWKRLYVKLRGRVTGQRYTKADNSFVLPAYFTLDLSANYRIVTRVIDVDVFVATNNMTDTEYQTIQGRPMRGFYISGGFQLSLGNRHFTKRSQNQ